MKIRIGNLTVETFLLSECNLNASEKMTVYALQNSIDLCPICGRKVCRPFAFTTQIDDYRCIKIYGEACNSCNAFFAIEGQLTTWLKRKKYNKGSPKIIDTYNYKLNLSRHRCLFKKRECIFRHYLLMSDKKMLSILITYNKEESDVKEWIMHYSNPLASALLIAEKENKPYITLDGIDYVIVRTSKKTIKSPDIEKDIQAVISGQNKTESLDFSKATVYIYRGNISCLSHHKTEEVRLVIKDLPDKIQLYAVYCYECDQYLMKYADYEKILKQYKLFPLKVVLLEKYEAGDVYGRAEKSPLMLNGYSVSKNKKLLRAERQKILSYVIDHGILSKREVLDYLEYFIAKNSHIACYREAISKWEEDKQFVLDYSKNAVPVNTVVKIERLKK